MTSLHDGRRLHVAEAMSARISDALASPPPLQPSDDRGLSSRRWRHQSLSSGAAGIAVLHGVRARDGHGSQERVHAWLTRATAEDLSAGRGAGLWFGAPAVAFALTLAVPQRYRRARTHLDSAVTELGHRRVDAAHARINARARPELSEFDLVRGLTGLGAHLLHRDPHGELMGRILEYLVHLTSPVCADDEAGRHAPGWWSAEAPSRRTCLRFRGGHANFGMAHGIAGPLALLALALRHGITVDGHTGAVEAICAWLDTWRQDSPAGPSWPKYIGGSELLTGRPVHTGPGRPSWCYGTPGLARAQQLAALALHDHTRQQAAEDALARCLADPGQLGSIIDRSLCHGWAGLLVTTWSVASDARAPTVGLHLPPLLDRLLEHAEDPLSADTSGLIDGGAGMALALHSIAAGTTGWQTCLLLN